MSGLKVGDRVILKDSHWARGCTGVVDFVGEKLGLVFLDPNRTALATSTIMFDTRDEPGTHLEMVDQPIIWPDDLILEEP